MRKLVSLILAVAVLTALCACAEKMNQMQYNTARELAMQELWIHSVRAGEYAMSYDIIELDGTEYARVSLESADTWDEWDALLRSVYTDEAADEVIADGDVIPVSLGYAPELSDAAENDSSGNDLIVTYVKYTPGEIHAESDLELYVMLSIASVEFIENSTDRAVAEIVYNSMINGELIAEQSRTLEFENTTDGWRIASPTEPLEGPVIVTDERITEERLTIAGLEERSPGNGTITLLVTRDADGRLKSVERSHFSGEVLLQVSDHEILLYVWEAKMIYLVDVDTLESSPALSETAYGFTCDDYAPLNGKYESIKWCDFTTVSPDGRYIAYVSNKYVENGEPALHDAVWLYNVETGEELRIDPPDGEYVDGSFREWSEDGGLCISFGTFHNGEDGFYNARYIYNIDSGILTRTDIDLYIPNEE